MKTELILLRECAAYLLDAADMVNDGPDESDMAFAESQLVVAIAKAKEARALRDATATEQVDELLGVSMLDSPVTPLPFYPTDEGE